MDLLQRRRRCRDARIEHRAAHEVLRLPTCLPPPRCHLSTCIVAHMLAKHPVAHDVMPACIGEGDGHKEEAGGKVGDHRSMAHDGVYEAPPLAQWTGAPST
uniref:Uncharacterized protein n=1 Tax=Oryza sativa subsp. japonica TaxID=39947 RepID=Q6K2Y6_ORYSJ|nr:hypothetical protein [Oryza sativa Japonica Group]